MRFDLFVPRCCLLLAVLMTCLMSSPAVAKGIKLDAKLTATVAAPDAKGKAEFRVHAHKQRLQVQVQQLGADFVGKTLTVQVVQAGTPLVLGTMVVRGHHHGNDDDEGNEGEAHLHLKNSPTINVGDVIQVLDGATLLLDGTFAVK